MALVAAAGVAAGAAYLNGKYQLDRDIRNILHLKRAEREYARRLKDGRLSPWYMLAETCARQPHDRAIWTRERSWTWQELHDHTVQLAQWMLEEGVQPGDLVALYLQNSAEFLMIVFATFAIGAGPALINYNLEGKSLLHCLDVAQSKLMIVDPETECARRVEASRAEITAAGTKIVMLDEELKKNAMARPVVVPGDNLRKNMKPEFPFGLIYTSGTTGQPKGMPYTIQRMHMQGSHLAPAFDAVPGTDCWYCPMPLYHGTGYITAASGVLTGLGAALTPRFSVSRFWPDIHDSGSTRFIYVGETARYLLNAPPHPLERKHNLRLMYGNGLRPDVWQKFQERFNIPEVAEFFSSSEGMLMMIARSKNEYLRACVGHHGGIARMLLRNTYIPVAVDYDTGDVWRDPKTGFAKRTPYVEGGEILVAVPSKAAFAGYRRNPNATDKRFAANVFKKGDVYYRAGDALRRDPDGHWFFLDRLGDTFRWKSENVSTSEVAESLGRYPGIAEANVFGVEVPGHEGRAGCAAIHLSESSQLDYADLLRYARAHLPRYAVPLFLRVVKRSSHIHNHKQNKVGLRKEGIDPEKIGTEEKDGGEDLFLWWQPGTDKYKPFGRKDWERLVQRKVML